jgi:hypothetical protein
VISKYINLGLVESELEYFGIDLDEDGMSEGESGKGWEKKA